MNPKPHPLIVFVDAHTHARARTREYFVGTRCDPESGIFFRIFVFSLFCRISFHDVEEQIVRRCKAYPTRQNRNGKQAKIANSPVVGKIPNTKMVVITKNVRSHIQMGKNIYSTLQREYHTCVEDQKDESLVHNVYVLAPHFFRLIYLKFHLFSSR